MTARRLLTAISLTAFVSGGLIALSAPSSAADDGTICIGGENQRKPGQYQGICVGQLVDIGHLPPRL